MKIDQARGAIGQQVVFRFKEADPPTACTIVGYDGEQVLVRPDGDTGDPIPVYAEYLELAAP